MDLRARTTATVTAVFFVALALVAVALTAVLRNSLADEVDRSNEIRAADILGQIEEQGLVLDPGFGADNDTFGAVYLLDTLEIVATSDVGADATELAATFDDFDRPFTADLRHLDETNGTTAMRAVAVVSVDPTGSAPGIADDGAVQGDLVVYVASSLDSVNRTMATTRRAAFVAVPALTALVALLTWLVAGWSLRPVDRMRAAVDAIGADDLEQRVAVPPGSGSLPRLAATMNGMLDRITVSQRRQRQFVSDASHELRSPLASMQAQLDVDLAHPGTVDWTKTATALRVETERMRRLVDDMLLLARADHATAVDRTGHTLVDLDDVVRRVAGREVDTTAVSAGLVRGNPDQLHRLVENLVTNARHHATRIVTAGVSESNGHVMLWIDDDGDGIAPADRHRVFERFVRLDDSRTRARGGSGLGLAICAEIVAAHEGTIRIDDSPLGGARFVVILPSAEAGARTT